MEQEGRFDTASLASLFLELMRENYVGSVHLKQGRKLKCVVFDGEHIAQADSNVAEESLLHQLVADEVVDGAAADRARQIMVKKKASEEAALMALKLVPAKDLVRFLRKRTERRVTEAFAWTTGEYRLDPESRAAKGTEAFRVNGVALVITGLARHARPDVILQQLEARLTEYPSSRCSADEIANRCGLDPSTASAIAGLDSEKTLWDQLGLQSDPSLVAAVAALGELDIIGFSETPGAASAVPEDNAEEALDPGPQIEIIVGDGVQEEAPKEVQQKEAREAARDEELAEEIEAKYAALGELDYYELLGIPRDAKPAAVKKAYLLAAKRFHPDALKRRGLESLKSQAGEVFAAIGKAHTVLSDSASRRDYDAGGVDSFDTDRLMQAETLYRQAEIMMRAGRFGEAAPLLANTVKLWPDEGAYQSAYGWALYKKRPSEPERAREHLELALELRQDDAQAFFYFSVVLKKLGEHGAADAALAKAKQLDPSVG